MYPTSNNKAHTADLSRFVGAVRAQAQSLWILSLCLFDYVAVLNLCVLCDNKEPREAFV